MDTDVLASTTMGGNTAHFYVHLYATALTGDIHHYEVFAAGLTGRVFGWRDGTLLGHGVSNKR